MNIYVYNPPGIPGKAARVFIKSTVMTLHFRYDVTIVTKIFVGVYYQEIGAPQISMCFILK